jgi:antitoxin component YwqK of YwqJK toxin-antitoxin module
MKVMRALLLSFFALVACSMPFSKKGEFISMHRQAKDRVIVQRSANIESDRGEVEMLPFFADSVLLCADGALPYYVSCIDGADTSARFYPGGKIKAKGSGPGEWRAYYENGKLMSRGMLRNGFPLGSWVFFYPGGKEKARGTFIPGKFELGCAGSGNYKSISIRWGTWQYWYPNGNKHLECTFAASDDGTEMIYGNYYCWYESGQMKTRGKFEKGSMNNTWTWWYENGNKMKEGHYKYRDCGLEDYVSFECADGEWLWWDEKGKEIKKVTYVDGRPKE